MKVGKFKFDLDEKVNVEKNNFSGIVSMCAIQGNPKNPDIVYYIEGATSAGWYPERLLKEAE